MITVDEAEKIILSQLINFGIEDIPFQQSLGRVLARDLTADRDLPPYDRVTMDGIAIRYEAVEKEIPSFRIIGTQAAGEDPIESNDVEECIEIMTGAALPASLDTVVRYEDVVIENGQAHIKTTSIKKGQNIHFRGSDKKKGEVVAKANQIISPSLIGTAASTGYKNLPVKKLPRTLIISTGDELVDINEKPSSFQIRRSNCFCMEAVLKQHSVPADSIHLADNEQLIKTEIGKYLEDYDALLLSGGMSMGKFDYLPRVLEELSVERLFYKVQQRPGKPFWFGRYEQKIIFGFPGNPVSSFLCLHRYFLPWLDACLGILPKKYFAVLEEDFAFSAPLTYFLPVKLGTDMEGRLSAKPIQINGSGDFSSLVEADAFMELPAEKTFFQKGEVFRIWPLNPLFS